MSTHTLPRTALVTGATGYVGAQLVPALLADGWTVRVLTRSPDKLPEAWRDRVDVRAADATDPYAVAAALRGADAAWYLLHSMDGRGDFVQRDRDMANIFAYAARSERVGRLVYLSGLHPPHEELSPHLASRVEVGQIFLDSGVPTAVLQAGVVLGAGSASFQMLRHLTERLPAAFGPKWLHSTIQPISIEDVVFYLVRAADLPDDANRTFDIGMDEVLTYEGMMKRYAQVAGLSRRRMGTVPVLTPGLASHWVGLVTPVSSAIATPLVGSLIHDAVVHEDDARQLMGVPPSGMRGFDDAVRAAMASYDPTLWSRTAVRVGAGVLAASVVGSLLTTPRSHWYASLRKPPWQPPSKAFPVVWTTLYGAIWVAATSTLTELTEAGKQEDARAFARALAINLTLNAGWSGIFFRGHALRAATAAAALLAASSTDLTRRAAPTGAGKAAGLGAYAAWTAFAALLSADVARRNPDEGGGVGT